MTRPSIRHASSQDSDADVVFSWLSSIERDYPAKVARSVDWTVVPFVSYLRSAPSMPPCSETDGAGQCQKLVGKHSVSVAALARESVSEESLIEETAAHVRKVVAQYRAGGAKVEAAWHEAGHALGLTSRRVRSYCDQTVCSLPAAEYLTVRLRMRVWMDNHIRREKARIALLDAQYQALERDL